MRAGGRARSVPGEEVAPGPRVTDRALFHLISAWRSQATLLMREGDEDRVGPQYREGLSLLHAASMLEQAAGFCAGCVGRGEVYEAPEEDDESGWSTCSMCGGAGRGIYWHQCSECGEFEREPQVREVDPGVWRCDRCRIFGRSSDRLGLEKLELRWHVPLGRQV